MNISCCKTKFYFFVLFLLSNIAALNAQSYNTFSVNIEWKKPEKIVFGGDSLTKLSFENAFYDNIDGALVPYFRSVIPVYSDDIDVSYSIDVTGSEPVPSDEIALMPQNIDTLPCCDYYVTKSRDNCNIDFLIFPFYKNGDEILRILSCDVTYSVKESVSRNNEKRSYAENSVLESGKWYKLSLQSTGMYKITYSDFNEMGFPVSSINPKNIRLYHNGGGVIPVVNKEERHDDLVEIPIYVHGESDGSFDESDYVLFYARGPVTWKYNNGAYERVPNPYSDYSCVFLTADKGEGKRIQNAAAISDNHDEVVTSFLDYQLKEDDIYNLNNMGATWYFDKYDAVTSLSYQFDFPDIIKDRKCYLRAEVASKNNVPASFKFKANGVQISQLNFSKINSSNTFALTSGTGNVKFSSNKNNVDINLEYVKSGSSSSGWVDYISVNAWRKLKFYGNAMLFRNPECVDNEKIYRYEIENASNSMQVWDVTNPVEPKKMPLQFSSDVASFLTEGVENNEFVAFNGKEFKKPNFISVVNNQNLHSRYDFDYLIITHPNFVSQAERLKEIHSRIDDLEIEIVTTPQIYNEFSCGALDIAAIRDYIKMIYDKSDRRLRYVLLFGDASYDFKNKSGQFCFVPSYESINSCSADCNVSDDFFACLDANEGNMEVNGNLVDVAVGRMPVSTIEDATVVIDKIETYISDREGMGQWRKLIAFAADDDIQTYAMHAEQLEGIVRKQLGDDVNFDKIYLDAYPQIATSSGQRAPEFNAALTNRVEQGALIVDYIGHAGEVGWADERILTNDDIFSWSNSPKLHLMMTASCEFSRFDDHTRTSSGEYVFLSRYGGAIAMVSAARVTFADNNQNMFRRFYEHMFDIEGGRYITMGDMYVHSKQIGDFNSKDYAFFGDPALRLNYPINKVAITSINDHDVSYADTLKALQRANIKGVVTDFEGKIMTDFNGLANVVVYDKENEYTTLGDESQSAVMSFKLRDNVIYNGKFPVVNGEFSADIILPKDINYSYGAGLISLYAYNDETDAGGSYSNIIVGGMNQNAELDEEGPEIKLYIDDEKFVDGSMTNENPILLAFVKDKNGINTSSAAIGHDITATLSGATNKTYSLNQFYDSPLSDGDYGTLSYKFYNLNEGEHVLTFRVWDIYNNSSTATIRFNVVKSNVINIENVMNYPNPMSDYTNFSFEHNQRDSEIDIQIRIYNIMGQLVRTITEHSYGTNARIDPILWDATSDDGNKLPAGVYLYQVCIINSQNKETSTYSKLVIK